MSVETETAAVVLSSKATYTGSAAAGLGWLTSNEGLAFCGLIVGVCGLLVQLYFARKKDRREEAEHALRMQELQDEANK
jgi:NAD/NADP transhydrogenase beta subunit